MYTSYKKIFGRHCKYLATVTGVPFKVAAVVGHLPNHTEAIYLLSDIKAARNKVTKDDVKALESHGHDRCNITIKKLIGDHTWKRINHSAYNCEILADYLLGKEL